MIGRILTVWTGGQEVAGSNPVVPTLFFQTSPSAISAVGFLLGITAFPAQIARFKRRPVLSELPEQLDCKSLPHISFAWFKRRMAADIQESTCYNSAKIVSVTQWSDFEIDEGLWPS
jgi:hypothetical protein